MKISKRTTSSLLLVLLLSVLSLACNKKVVEPIKDPVDVDTPIQQGTFNGLIFKELFFNGERNSNMPDQYLVLFNNSKGAMYVDGVCIATCAHFNTSSADKYTAMLPDEVVVKMIYSIPGDGKQYLLMPGEQMVIAGHAFHFKKNEAVDTENKDNKISYLDLSGADFEAFDGVEAKDIDNEEVPNLIKHINDKTHFFLSKDGGAPAILFHPKEDMKSFLEKNTFTVTSNDREFTMCKVNQDLILDGIETFSKVSYDDVLTKSLPESVDKTSIVLSRKAQDFGQLVVRKSFEKDGRLFLKDTDDSSVDCEIKQGGNSFPKGYKNK